jgi:tetratricopeptide (TPR) repeat protein
VPDSPRIEELKRRVQSDPASIAFAALAEEYRRAERFEEAIETCRTGLVRHPSYLSAHVTLGRALIEVGRLQDARQELEFVLKLAPENLAAIRGLAEIHHRNGQDAGEVTPIPEPIPAIAVSVADAPPVARADVASHQPIESNTVLAIAAAALIPEPVLSIAVPSSDIVLAAPEELPERAPHVTYPDPVDPALAGLEEFLNAIIRARAGRAAAR